MTNSEVFILDRFANSQKSLSSLRTMVWLITMGAGFLQAWASRFAISPDGNSYLDIATAYLHGDWSHAINAYWSPFYSWLLALSLGTFRFSPYWDSTLLHLLNFVGLLFSLWSFEFLFRSLVPWKNQRRSSRECEELLPEAGWWILGYSLFLSTSLLVLSVNDTTPDVWVAGFTYLAAGLTIRITTKRGSPYLFAALGFFLGCAYLTKTFYFPLGFVFLLTAWLAAGNLRKTFRQAALGFLAFVLVAGPWVAALSRAKHRFTFGDVGKVAFAIFYDQLPQPYFWQGENASGIPLHPVRQLMVKPRLYEFATPVGGAYPPAFDPSYWMEGVHPHFRGGALLRVLRQSGGTFFQIWTIQLEFAVASLILFFLLPAKADWFLFLRWQFHLWVPPLIACLNYFIVLVEFRYVASFVLLLWLSAFASLLAKSDLPRRFALAVVLAALAATCIRIAKLAVSDLAAVFAGQQNLNWDIAQELRKLGSQQGDRVAGLSRVAEAHWARLAGVKIVAEIPLGDENLFWTADSADRQKILNLLASTGAKFLVTKYAPACAPEQGWVPLGTTGFYALRLPSGAQTRPVRGMGQ